MPDRALPDLVGRVRLDTRELDRGGQRAQRTLGDLTNRSKLAGGALDKLGMSGASVGSAVVGGLAAAGTALVAFGAKSVAHFNETAQSVRALQRITGQSAGDASKFVAAFDDMGISADKANGALFKLSKTTATNSKALEDLGIEVARTKDGGADLEGTFLNVADAVASTEDPARKAEIAFAAFGKQGQALLPILEKGRRGIQELFANSDLNFTQAQLDSAEDYRLAMDHLGDSVGKVQNRVGGALVPSLAKAAEGTAVLVDRTIEAADKSSWFGDILGGIADRVVPGVRPVIEILGGLSDGADDSAASAEDLAVASQALGISMDGLAGKTTGEVSALLDLKKTLDETYKSTLAQFDANFAYQSSLNDTEDAAAAVTAAQKAVNEAIRDHGASSQETATAREELTRALLRQQEQALRSAEAAGRLAEQDALLGGASDATLPKIDAQVAELERQRQQIAGAGGNTDAIQGMIDRLNSIRAEYRTSVITTVDTGPVDGLATMLGNLTGKTHVVPVTTTLVTGATGTPKRPSNAQSWFPGSRDSGGPVKAGEPYVIGSGRRELFVPKVDGVVLPRVPAGWDGAAAPRRAGNSAGSLPNVNLTVVMPNYLGDKSAVAKELAGEISRALYDRRLARAT